jgi:predicted Zn-dependent peptidase
MNRPIRLAALLGMAGLVTSAGPARANLEAIEDAVETFTLDNGLTFLVLERDTAPVFSFCTQVDAGGVDEVPGITGVAHMFEHMAFKGTDTIGVTDPEAEAEWLAKTDEAFSALLDERREGPNADPDRLAELEAAFSEAQGRAREFVKTNEFTQILEGHGVENLNAQTSLDWTRYFYSLPSNRLELWARLEGDRLSRPVLREFDTERNVVIEERRQGFESNPIGRLQGAFFGLTWPAHPYGDGVIGHRSDLETFTRDDAQEFFRTHYVASNMCVAVVGDVSRRDVEKLARRYFADVHAGPRPPRVDTVEPPQVGERRVLLEDRSQPVVMVGYPIPDNRHPDYPAYELLGSAIGDGRASRLTEALVKESRLCAQVVAGTGFPGEKYANTLVILAFVAAGEDPHEVEAAIYDVVESGLRESPITDDELAGVRTRLEASTIRSMRSNLGLAQNLALSWQIYGDWRRVFHLSSEWAEVTTDDVARVAESLFVRSNRNVAMIVSPEEGAAR